MSEDNITIELKEEDLEKVTGGGNVIDCDWGGEVKYTLELGHAYARNNALNYVYVPIDHVKSPDTDFKPGVRGFTNFHIFSCRYYEFDQYIDTHDVSFGQNDTITEVTGNIISIN